MPSAPGATMPGPDTARGARAAQALGEIIRNLNQSLELDRVTAMIVRYAAELLDASGARLWTLNDDETFTLAAMYGSGSGVVGERVPTRTLFADEAVRARRAVRTDDLGTRSERGRQHPELYGGRRTAALAAPLLVSGRPTGAVVVFGASGREFDGDDEELLLALAGHAAAAVENARLYRTAARTARHASILSDCARTLAAGVTPESVYSGLAQVVRRALQASGFAVYFADPATREVVPVHADGTGMVGAVADMERFWELDGGRVVLAGEPAFFTEPAPSPVPFAPAAPAPLQRGALLEQVRGVALLPLVVEGRPRGLLVLHFTHARTFDAAERQLLLDFAAQVAVAMRNAQLFVDLEHRAARLASVVQQQHHISAADSRSAVLAETHRAVAAVADAPTFAVLTADDAGECAVPEYVVVAGRRWPDGAALPASLGGPTVDAAWRTGEACVACRVVDGAPLAELCVPLTCGGRRIGVLQAQSPRPAAFDVQDVDVVTIVARQAAAALENVRLFEAQRAERELAEAAAAVATAALDAAGLREGAARILDVIARVVPMDGGGLCVTRGDVIEVVATTGALAPFLGDLVPLAESVSVRALRDGRPRSVPSFRTGAHPSRADAYPDLPATFVPLVAGGHSIGVLGTSTARPLGADALATLERLAPPVALALNALVLAEQERQRQARERTLAVALAMMPQPVFVLDAEGCVRFANAAAAGEYGYTLDELAGMDARTLVLGSAAPETGEQVHRRMDGGVCPACVLLGPIAGQGREDAGGAGGHVLSVRNLTEERRVAETLRQTEKLAALGELVAGVAHELNNPLTGVSAFAQLLLEDELTEDQLESVRLIKRESDRAVGVIRDLLVFSRKTGPRDVVVDVNALVLHTVRLRAYGLKSAGIELETDLACDLPGARGDDQKLQQVLLNLVVNAEYAMQRAPERRLKIRTRLADTSLEISVSDTGSGMSAETQQHIFEPFFTTKPAGVGTGLGLSVSYGIVQAHGGTITVDSAPGRGTTFCITLPVAGAAADHSRAADHDSRLPTTPTA